MFRLTPYSYTKIEECLICLCDVQKNQYKSYCKNCRTFYHKDCLDKWWNKNDDVFNKSEVWAAKNTPQHKPANLEHDEKQIVDRLYEPNKEDIVNNLIPRHLNIQMWKYLLESFASEQAARMLAMENATGNAEDMIKDLTLQFNKARQAAITTEMLEIVSGAEALQN